MRGKSLEFRIQRQSATSVIWRTVTESSDRMV